MTNIRTFFDNLYKLATNDSIFDIIDEYELKVYNLSDKEFFAWAGCNNINLNAMMTERVSYIQQWIWDIED